MTAEKGTKVALQGERYEKTVGSKAEDSSGKLLTGGALESQVFASDIQKRQIGKSQVVEYLLGDKKELGKSRWRLGGKIKLSKDKETSEKGESCFRANRPRKLAQGWERAGQRVHT